MSSFVFVTWGDRFLPKPWNEYSENTRNKLAEVLIGSFPKHKESIKNMSKDRREKIQEMENRVSSSPN
jgi:hypothetical protein